MPDFLKLHERYHQQLDNGERAQIKRATEPEDLLGLPAFYRLIGGASPTDLKQLARVAFFLPYIAKHSLEAAPLGRQLHHQKISEKRLFHIIRSSSPNDLIQLKRVLQQAKLHSINWQMLAETLFYWNANNKKQLMQDFYLQPNTDSDKD